MRREDTQWRPVVPASLHWSDVNEPISAEFGDIYYSRDNGLEESRYVFLQGNALPQRWQDHPRGHFCIAESGFGTGLNFLLTWQAWRALPEPRPRLHYLSIEKSPLAPRDLDRALSAWPALAPLATQLLEHYPGLVPGQHRVLLEQGRIRLDLWWEDIADTLQDLASRGQQLVDAWYLDGFAPACNQAMWSETVLRTAATLSLPGATFATFTAAGQVRRELTSAGFRVHKMPGFGRKRECLRGHISEVSKPPEGFAYTPWDIARKMPTAPHSAMVVGGGLAGCAAAAALARRGIRVTLLERDVLAGAGSGNDQGILYTRLSRKHAALADFALQSFRFAATFYRGMFQTGQLTEGLDGALCGSFHQSQNLEEMAALSAVLAEVPELAQVLDAKQARDISGIVQPSGGYWYPASGWLRPASICQALVNGHDIEVIEGCGELALEADDNQWQASAAGTVVAAAPCAVIATGTAAVTMPQLSWLPLQSIRGQTTDLPSMQASTALKTALCHQGYIAPARNGRHCIGATFKPHDNDPELRVGEHKHNLAKLADAVPAWRPALEQLDSDALDGRVGFRCASPDYLPVVGPVPNLKAFLRDYAPLRKNARQTLATRGEYLPGLYLTAAHGSRGLTSTPLAAELLASLVCAEAPPLSRTLCRALAPARFIMRDLTRNRI